MKTKEEIVNNWLPRYTGKTYWIALENTSCSPTIMYYVELFAKWNNVQVEGRDKEYAQALQLTE